MRRTLAFTSVFVAVSFMMVSATIINVPDDYETIQQGIDASSDGDTVLVQPGTYLENINFNGHNVVLGSLFLTTGNTAYISTTIIDGNSVGTVVTFENEEDNTAVINGFTIQNGNSDLGGGISCSHSSPTITKNIISENSAAYGAGIGCHSSDPLIINNTIQNGMANYGGGIRCEWESSPTIRNNIISGNGATFGGGIDCIFSNPVIIDNTIRENTGSRGGGIRAGTESSFLIKGNVISGNSVTRHGGGIQSINALSPTISNNIITGNSAGWDGGGIMCANGSHPTIINNTIYANSADRNGGGIGFHLSANSIVVNNISWANAAGSEGHEIYFLDNSPIVNYCDIRGGWEGEGNIDIPPLFRDPESGDFHLKAEYCGDEYNSPCIDAGDPAIFDSMLGCDWGLGELRSDMGAYGGAAEGPACAYVPGDCDHNGIPLELGDAIAMIGIYRGDVDPYYTCDCPPHGSDFAPESDPNGNCVAFELPDVVTEIAAYRGTGTVYGCEDCPGSQ